MCAICSSLCNHRLSALCYEYDCRDTRMRECVRTQYDQGHPLRFCFFSRASLSLVLPLLGVFLAEDGSFLGLSSFLAPLPFFPIFSPPACCCSTGRLKHTRQQFHCRWCAAAVPAGYQHKAEVLPVPMRMRMLFLWSLSCRTVTFSRMK